MAAQTLASTTFFSPEHQALTERVEEFAKTKIASLPEDESNYLPRSLELLKRVAREGLLGYVVPAAYGGHHRNVDIRSVCVLRRGLARHSSLADTMFAMQGLGSYPITVAGSEALKKKFLPKVASGEWVATFALTEPDAGSDATAIRTAARREGDEYVIDGHKKFISNAGIADFYVVFAKTDVSQGRKGISAIVVEKDRPGLRTEKLEVIAPHPIGKVWLEGLRVPVENRLGQEGEGFSIMMKTLESFRTTVGAAALGMGERALEEATSYVQHRSQFGKTLGEFQGLRFMLAEMATELEASRLLVFQAAAKLDQSHNGNPAAAGSAQETAMILSSSMAKMYATEAAQRVIDKALQIHGGTGVLKGSVVERLYREIRALRVYEGTTEIQKEIIAHQLLKAGKKVAAAKA